MSELDLSKPETYILNRYLKTGKRLSAQKFQVKCWSSRSLIWAKLAPMYPGDSATVLFNMDEHGLLIRRNRTVPFILHLKLLLLVLGVLWPLAALASEEVATLDTRPGVTMKLLVSYPETPSNAALLMFPGKEGYNQFSISNGEIRKGNNFLVRTIPSFTKSGFIVAVIDTPSDRPQGMDDSFRTSKKHLQDVTKAVEYLSARGCTSIYLVGTSRGTLSVAYLGAELKHDSIKGIVLTSTMKYSKFLRWIPIEKTTYPVLIVHNADDGCKSTPYDEASLLPKKFKSSPKVTFQEVSGGLPPQSGPCEPLSAHGFFGIEDRVVAIISDWISH